MDVDIQPVTTKTISFRAATQTLPTIYITRQDRHKKCLENLKNGNSTKEENNICPRNKTIQSLEETQELFHDGAFKSNTGIPKRSVNLEQ